ncbi:NAC domain-containing protein 53-like [Zingiber officinale]|uniref:NAC domain-containing protein n=1 Tax=Zingiber officinale TaxID=94328 RepID=A0A8J5EKS5_ZINOF|nr:NAC domain-containing protein 53-like [Zingiber officinale]KAG6466569.1 hypothetical protein ZIOFF_075657 [Zingiber officinale]
MNAAVVSSSDLPPLPAAASRLAPGFRFHPTDDELVSYYLKRKVRGLPLRVDAVAEVDLYRCEPWELPGLSRIRSRDQEWYFFSSLGRKYSNQSRTNRATLQGYWKTTGKDRPVRRGPRVVGVKKTLVFHAGRAPRGTRTNWVMHEYRLEDEELTKSGISQDAYVLCRVFQKSGSGPMNGAQYGAPFLEEEWEEEADSVVLLPDGGDYIATEQEYFEISDFVQSDDLKNQQENGSNFSASLDTKECGSLAEDVTNLSNEAIEDASFTNLADKHRQQSVAVVVDEIEKQHSFSDCGHNHNNPNVKEEYAELSDLADTVTVANPSYQESDSYPMKSCHAQNMEGINEDINLEKVLDVEEFFDSMSEDADHPEEQQISLLEDNIYVPPNDLDSVDDHCPSDQDKMALCEAPSNNLFPHENTELNGFLYSPTLEPSGFEMFDDLLAYFDATNDNLHYCTRDSECISPPEAFDFVGEVGCSTNEATKMVPDTTIIDGASSSSGSSVVHDQSGDEYKGIVIEPKPDDHAKEPNKDSAKKRLKSMLDAISAPVPFSEFPLSGKLSATHSASPIHVTAGIIHIYGSTMPGEAAHWPSQKNRHAHLIVSYSVSDNLASKTAGHDLVTKYQVNPVLMAFRGGLYLFFFSWLILAITYGVGMRCMTRKLVL